MEPGDRVLSLLNGIRGLAAVAILFWHYQHFYFPPGQFAPSAGFQARLPLYALFWPLYDFGHYAVQIFWILSGVVFAHVYLQSAVTTRGFAVNRFARLYPLHLLTLLAMAVLQGIAERRVGGPVIYFVNGPGQFLQHLLMASGWGFAGGRDSFNAPMWSVSAEMAAYLVFWVSRRWLVRHGLLWPMVFVAAGVAARAAGIENDIVRCLYHFMAGVGVLVIARAIPQARLLLGLSAATVIEGLAGLLVLPFESAMPLAVLLVSAGLLMASLALDRAVGARLARASNTLGDSAYGLYLWHVPVQAALFLAFPRVGDLAALASRPLFLGSFIGGMLLLAWLSFRLIERPARIAIRKLAGERRPDPPVSAP
ncbi:MAG: acyltransferase [Croceibacterium sp.]